MMEWPRFVLVYEKRTSEEAPEKFNGDGTVNQLQLHV